MFSKYASIHFYFISIMRDVCLKYSLEKIVKKLRTIFGLRIFVY
jgi:hypothetical protein